MFHIIFCDDNSQYIESLRAYVQEACAALVPQGRLFSIGPAFGGGQEVLQYVQEHHVDVLLLDIDMPDMSGFDVARILCRQHPYVKIIFMSAYDNFVYSSFEYYPFAYLRKSHVEQELPCVLERVADKLNQSARRIELVTTQGNKTFEVNEILYVESKRNYCTVHLVGGGEYACRSTLTAFEAEVEDYDFFRIHSAFMVNLEHVDRVLDNRFVLINCTKLPISQKRGQEFKKTYMDYVRRCFNA